MTQLLPMPVFRAEDNNGNPLAGGKLYSYQAGTTTPQATYTDSTGGTPNANPVLLNARGEASVWLTAGQAYKFLLTDASDVTIPGWPRDNVTAAEAGGSVAALTARLADTASSANGAGMVSINLLLAYARGSVGASLRHLCVDVMQLGAAGDGAQADDSYIQEAITLLGMKGGIVRLPAGTYKITQQLNWVSTVNAGIGGIYFIGDGRDSTRLMSYLSNAPLLYVQGTVLHAAGGVGSYFANGGGIFGLTFDGTNATGTADGLMVLGWQYGDIEDCYFGPFPRDGIHQWVDSGYSTPDYTSSTLRITDSWFWNCLGWGVNQAGPIGAFSWKFDKALFGYCGGALNITSAGNSLEDCSFVGSGFSGNTAGSVIIGSAGIHVQVGSASGGTNRFYARGCEFDFARLAHIRYDYCSSIVMEGGRLIFNDRNGTGSLTPAVGITIAAAGAGSNANGVDLRKLNVRIDTAGSCSVYQLVNNANVSDVSITPVAISNNSGATVTEFVGFQANNYNLVYGYYCKSGTSGGQVIAGKPLPEYIGFASSATVPNGATVKFSTQDAVNAAVFGTVLDTNGRFPAPTTGYYGIEYTVCVTGALTSELYQFQVLRNGGGTPVVLDEFDYAGNGLARTSMVAPRTRVFLNAGDTLEVFSAGANGRAIVSANSQLIIKQVT